VREFSYAPFAAGKCVGGEGGRGQEEEAVEGARAPAGPGGAALARFLSRADSIALDRKGVREGGREPANTWITLGRATWARLLRVPFTRLFAESTAVTKTGDRSPSRVLWIGTDRDPFVPALSCRASGVRRPRRVGDEGAIGDEARLAFEKAVQMWRTHPRETV